MSAAPSAYSPAPVLSKKIAGANVPLPMFFRSARLFVPLLAVTMSMSPSPSQSSTAMPSAPDPTA